MILIFLGSMRATVAVLFSIPISVLATMVALQIGGSSVNTMVLGGLALALSRLIDNSVVVLENIYRHLELGEPPVVAAEKGGREVALPVLAATLTTVVVFFPVTLLYGVSKFLFSSLALAVVLSLFASYAVAMTVVPLFCANFLKHTGHESSANRSLGQRFNAGFNHGFEGFLKVYDRAVKGTLRRPLFWLLVFAIGFGVSLLIFPHLELAFFPRTDAGQFVINVKAPSGTKLTETEKEIAQLELLVRSVVPESELGIIVSNIGVDPGFSAIYTSNSAMHTAFVQVGLKEGHKVDSYEYMSRVKARMERELPDLAAYFSSGSLVDAVLNLGLAAPIDVQVAGTNLQASYQATLDLARQIRQFRGVADAYIPQDLDYPALRLDIDRTRAGELGLTEKEVVQNVITALTSNQMVAPNIWIDPKNNNNYFLNVQYPEQQIQSLLDLRAIPLHGVGPEASDPSRHGQQDHPFRSSHRGRSLSNSPRAGYLHPAADGGSRCARESDRCAPRPHEIADGRRCLDAWNGRRNAVLVPQFRDWPFAVTPASLSDSGRAVPLLYRSLYHPARISARALWRTADAVAHWNYSQRDVPDGRRDVGWDRHVEQHFDCGVCSSPAPRRDGTGRGSRDGQPRSATPRVDDVSCHSNRAPSHGAETRRRQRILRAARASPDRRTQRIGIVHRFSCSRGLPSCVCKTKSAVRFQQRIERLTCDFYPSSAWPS